MIPESFRQRLYDQKYIDAGQLLPALQEPSPVSVRLNREKWSYKPVDSEPVPWSKNGFYLRQRPSFTYDPLFHAGCYYPQEASSMFIEEIFGKLFPAGMKIRALDLCGAPGGKSTHLSSLIGANGFLIANEVIRSRASILAENITKWGIPNTLVTRNDPAHFSALPGYFDLILVDAPCSGEGMFRDPVALSEWSVGNTELCSVRQRRIVMDVWPALKEGGMMIYSTCTFNPGENEENIRWLINSREAETYRLDISDFKGITEIDHGGVFGYGFYPGSIKGEGLFFSVIKKTGRTEEIVLRSRPDKTQSVSADYKRIAGEWTLFREGSLSRQGDDIISLPCSFNDHALLSKHLNIVKSGTRIFSVRGKDLLPSHDLAVSVALRKNVFYTLDLEYARALKYLERENIIAANMTTGWILVSYMGVNLGFMKNIGNRINNYFPIEWRIRNPYRADRAETIIRWEQK